MNAVPSALPLPAARISFAEHVGIALLLSLLVVDGFPLGISLLREFGARPVNFMLGAAGLALLGRSLHRLRHAGLARRPRTFLALSLGITAANLFVALTMSGPNFTTISVAWLLQLLMLSWGIVSYFVWRQLLWPVDAGVYARLITITAIVPISAFYAEYFGFADSIKPVFDFFHDKTDLRPSGLATEPSIYAAWINVVWPIVLFRATAARSAPGRIAAYVIFALLVSTAYLSHARTVVVVLLLQIAYYAWWALRRQRTFGGLVRAGLLASVLAGVALFLLWERLTSLADVQDNGSNIARFAYTISGWNVFLSHLWTGVGIGQFNNVFSSYLPDFGLGSSEVAGYVFGLLPYRASTFNMFVRLLCEFGLPIGLFLGYLVVRPLWRAVMGEREARFMFYAALSAVGGVGFWLTQDQYGYQPAILSLAVLSNALAANRVGHDQ
jgi:hypothetical protein